MRQKLNFDADWLFILGNSPEYKNISADETAFRKVRLPHDWSCDYPVSKDEPTGGGGGFAKAGIGWYRKRFNMEKLSDNEMAELCFEGVYMDSTVYVNGRKAGGHGYGYSSFYVDMTPYLVEGENVVAVRVNNSYQPNSRWYTGSGIYRDVWLEKHEKVHFDHFGVRAATNGLYPRQNSATLQIMAAVANESAEEVHVGIIHKLYNREGELVSSSGIALYLDAGETSDSMTRPTVDSPYLWSDDDPYLYTLVSQLKVEDETVDESVCRVGIRTAVFDKDKGFLLNGNQVKIKGMCIHHDCGVTGAVGYEEIWRRRLKELRDMGCNGIRCAHNPPVPLLLDICDELGFLVMDEAYDEWYLSKNKNDNYYSESLAFGSSMFFNNHAEEDVRTMVRRDYSHPSVIIWSIGNEIPEQSSVDGPRIVRYLRDIVHREDTTRAVTSACDNIVAVEPIRTLREFENDLDVTGYNYPGRWRERAETFYEEDRLEFPNRKMIGTEDPSAGGPRGVYDGSGFFGNYATATLHHEALWRYTASRDFVAGDYFWTGISYLGETRWPNRGAGGGPIDSAGFKKDAWWYFRAIWNTNVDTLHIAPQWNFPGQEGMYKQVVVYTNLEEVELYINDKLVGKKGLTLQRYGAKNNWFEGHGRRATTNDLHLEFDVVYEPGVLKAVGYRNGEAVMTEVVETVGPMASLNAKAVDEKVKPFGIAQIELTALDGQGRFVNDVNDIVSVEIEGKARYIGMDSGNMADLSMWNEPSRAMYHGMLLCVLQPEEPGQVTAHFTMKNGMKADCVITVEE